MSNPLLQSNSKLYFLLHGTRFAAKNACPQGDESLSEVARFFAMFEQSGVAEKSGRVSSRQPSVSGVSPPNH
jgi:hypothetical protein